ncbi:MAG: hypothetical protein KDB22_14260 [Planctomycetales bacterium]|nr:hypothetical protein [Planctomycetales bacterium]
MQLVFRRTLPLCLSLGLAIQFLHCQSALSQTATAPTAESIPTALFEYVQKPDEEYAWKLNGEMPLPGGKTYEIALTSQKWHGIVWQHVLQVYEPEQITFPNKMLLMVTGGSIGGKPDRGDLARGLALAKLCGARVATIHQVPNQPLFGGRKEDDLITDTWLKYLESGDETWPLLFPMVKSAVRAMDALQEFAKEKWESPVEGFVITGASKRGWTSWLTPVADSRVIATAPIVIDVLNFRKQMKHQLDTWGEYSEQIYDYTSKGLIVEGEESEREMKLRQMMDPYTYREQLTLPKLIVNGTNDPYWVVDAMKWYWDDLRGPKYILQVPNAGHGLDGGVEHALSTVAAYFRHIASNTQLPELSWQHSDNDSAFTLTVSASQTPREAKLWVAMSDDKDFRDEKWSAQPMQANASTFSASIPQPVGRHVARYAELTYEIDGVAYSLCTLIFRD